MSKLKTKEEIQIECYQIQKAVLSMVDCDIDDKVQIHKSVHDFDTLRYLGECFDARIHPPCLVCETNYFVAIKDQRCVIIVELKQTENGNQNTLEKIG